MKSAKIVSPLRARHRRFKLVVVEQLISKPTLGLVFIHRVEDAVYVVTNSAVLSDFEADIINGEVVLKLVGVGERKLRRVARSILRVLYEGHSNII